MLQVDELFLKLDGKPIINGMNLQVKRGKYTVSSVRTAPVRLPLPT